jgi:hypothetical protein
VEAAFEDFHRMMLFIHLQPAYASRAWVRVDGDDFGKTIITKLQKKFSSWDSSHFDTYAESNFELFYPLEFHDRAKEILQKTDKELKRDAKRDLFNEVIAWLDADPTRGKNALARSAQPVIQDLKNIAAALSAMKGK